MAKKTKLTVSKILSDFKRAYDHKKKFLDEAEEDFEYTLGKQWDDKDVQSLKNVGVRALTINKIRPNIWLLAGIESQNRSDFVAYPEGNEDSIKAEIATRLLKNIMKNTQGNHRLSEAFEDGNTCGESFIEPWLDYTHDMLNGKMRLKKINFNRLFPEPGGEEYGLEDRQYVCKVTYNLSKDELIQLFPDKEREIEKIADGRISIDSWNPKHTGREGSAQEDNYNKSDTKDPGDNDSESDNDLLEYYYKKFVKKYYIIDRKIDDYKEANDKAEADAYAESANQAQESPDGKPRVVVVERLVPEIWVCSLIGNNKIDDSMAWSYPKFKHFPFFPYYCYRATVPIRNKELMVQGITRGLKDLNHEYNKRRTQELRLLNSSANSGWLEEKGAWVDPEMVKQLGSSPGVNLQYNQGRPMPQKIQPTQLSQGHAQLAIENTQDIKESSGINSDLLAMTDKTQSGRAINLRQKQGLVMVQKIFDHFALTKKLLGKFLLTQFESVYDIDSAMKVLGDAFISDNFQKPVMEQKIDGMTGQPVMDPETGQPAQQPVMDPMTGQMQMETDAELAAQTVNAVLTDTQLGNYDVSIGEGASNETVKYANWVTLMEMIEKGVPIPPDVIVQESMLSEAHKDKVAKAIEQQMQAQARAAQAPPAK